MELTRFKVPADRADELLQARPAMVADFRADREGFLDAQLIRVDDETWLDVVWWRSSEDFAASREKGANLPGIKAFFAPIAEMVSVEEGTTEGYASWGGAKLASRALVEVRATGLVSKEFFCVVHQLFSDTLAMDRVDELAQFP
ncbi:antibiotic biosynthesis monooxygenase [Amycolatopsis sp. lyj-90]|uniref:antibiotic biosynthesis monooxygenase n=1 Tax=Amycolatopsis sp. lyj-90 TaxID=2789285 RepID=UPI00397A1427